MTSYSENGKTPLVRIAYAHGLFELSKNQSGREQYSVTLLLPKTADKSALEALIFEAAKKEWGEEKAKNLFANKAIKSPFLDGDGDQGSYLDDNGNRVRKDGHAGNWFIRVASGKDYKPKVFDRRTLPIVDKNEVPSGSTGYAVVNAYTWENKENGKGVSFGISMFQLIDKATGDHLFKGAGGGAPTDPNQFFEKVEDTGAAPDSTKNGAGAGGLFGD